MKASPAAGFGLAAVGALIAGAGYFYATKMDTGPVSGFGLTPAAARRFTYTPGSAGVCASVETSIQSYLAQMVGFSHALASECGPNAARELQRRFAAL